MTADPLLEVRDLSKRFAARAGRDAPPWVIQDLSFSVSDGEIVLIWISVVPGRRPARTPSGPSTAASTSRSAGTIVMTASERSPTSRGEPAGLASKGSSRSIASGTTS